MNYVSELKQLFANLHSINKNFSDLDKAYSFSLPEKMKEFGVPKKFSSILIEKGFIEKLSNGKVMKAGSRGGKNITYRLKERENGFSEPDESTLIKINKLLKEKEAGRRAVSRENKKMESEAHIEKTVEGSLSGFTLTEKLLDEIQEDILRVKNRYIRKSEGNLEIDINVEVRQKSVVKIKM